MAAIRADFLQVQWKWLLTQRWGPQGKLLELCNWRGLFSWHFHFWAPSGSALALSQCHVLLQAVPRPWPSKVTEGLALPKNSGLPKCQYCPRTPSWLAGLSGVCTTAWGYSCPILLPAVYCHPLKPNTPLPVWPHPSSTSQTVLSVLTSRLTMSCSQCLLSLYIKELTCEGGDWV
jgi:hypothetical protein